ncbi:MAG: hypothetical protein PHP23_05215 [Desulfobacterales bacterium]|nr:hypothetical protein [Desulfobacterales bacterium]MDD4392262.1 hypothetical protein [Desulfobacterales bacterium]
MDEFISAKGKRLQQEGNVLALERNKKISENAGKIADIINRLAGHMGPISDALNQYAKELSDAKSTAEKNDITTRFLQAARKAAEMEIQGTSAQVSERDNRYDRGRESDPGTAEGLAEPVDLFGSETGSAKAPKTGTKKEKAYFEAGVGGDIKFSVKFVKPWSENFPNIAVHTTAGRVSQHEDYAAAKADDSTLLAITLQTLTHLRKKFNVNQLEKILRKFNIVGNIEALTNSEGRYILKFKNVNAFRNRILAEAEKRVEQNLFSIFQGEVRENELTPPEHTPRTAITKAAIKSMPIAKAWKIIEQNGKLFIRTRGNYGFTIEAVDSITEDEIAFRAGYNRAKRADEAVWRDRMSTAQGRHRQRRRRLVESTKPTVNSDLR